MTLRIDALAHTNRLRELPPLQKLLFAFVLLAIAILTKHLLSELLIILWLSVWTVGYGGIPLKVYLRLLLIPGLFLGLSLPGLVLNVIPLEKVFLLQGDSLTGIGLASFYLYISRQGISQGTLIILRSLASVSCLLFVLCSVPFSQLLQTLRQLKVPSLFIELMLLMYRFIVLLLNTAVEIRLAQQVRGSDRTYHRWLFSLSVLITQLMRRSLQKYQQFSFALNARGFQGNLPLSVSPTYSYSRRYALESLLGCTILIILEFIY